MITREEANVLMDRVSTAVRELVNSRSMLESKLFQVQVYMPVGLYNFFEKSYTDIHRLSQHVSPEEVGRHGKQLISEVNQKTQFAIITGYLTGREQVIMDGELSQYYGADEDEMRTKFMLDFWKRSTSAYRNDGKLLVREGNGIIEVLPQETAFDLESELVRAEEPIKEGIQGLNALLRSYLYLLNCESRGGVFAHGPYQVKEGVLVCMEFRNLWKGFEPAKETIPYPNIGIVMKLNGVRSSFDDVGTMVTEPLDYNRKIAALNLFARDEQASVKRVDLDEVEDLKTGLTKARKALFDEVRSWDHKRRIVAGALQYSDYSSYLKAFELPIEAEHKLSDLCLEKYLPAILKRGYHPFYQRFMAKGKLFSYIGES